MKLITSLRTNIIPIFFIMFVGLFLVIPFAHAESVPDWIKNTAGWWATDAISETEFINAIQYLINEKIIKITSSTNDSTSSGIPDWIKNTAGWWATDAISETEFINAIQFLANNGIIQTNSISDKTFGPLKPQNSETIPICKEIELKEN